MFGVTEVECPSLPWLLLEEHTDSTGAGLAEF